MGASLQSPLGCPLGLVAILLPVLFKSAFGFGCGPARLFENANRVVPVIRLSWYQSPARIRLAQHCNRERRDRQRLKNISHTCFPSVVSAGLCPDTDWGVRPLVALTSFGGLFICAKDLFVEAAAAKRAGWR
jgi:hypothetical protein